jgi:hypothetical protein
LTQTQVATSLLATLVCLAFGSVLQADRQQAGLKPTVKAFSPMDLAEQYVRAIYPELAAMPDLRYMAATYGAWKDERWRYDMVEVQVHPVNILPIRSGGDMQSTLLHVLIAFDTKGLKRADAEGSYVSQAQRNSVFGAVEGGEDWPVARVRSRLQEAGAMYSDDEAAVREHLPIEGWKGVFGEIHVDKGRLGTSPFNGKSPGDGLGEWHFSMSTSRPTKATYEISVEPFHGRVVDVVRTN